MSIRIAQASSSETFGKYGKAPNQRRTGASRTKPEGNLDGELNVVDWYGGWEKVYRAVDPIVAERIATFMCRAVSNGNYIGYSWSGNTELWDALHKKNSTDPMDVDTLVNCDCATLVGAAVYYSGIQSAALRALVTWKMESVLTATNAFDVLTDKELCENGKGIQRGDILWKAGHTAVALDNDITYRVTLNDNGLFFADANGKTTGKYPNDVNLDGLLLFERVNFYGVTINAGTIGTRGAQMAKAISKAGYKPVTARLCYVSDSSLANVVPFFGNGDNDKTLHVNFYRATRSKCTIDAGVMVIYIRSEVTLP